MFQVTRSGRILTEKEYRINAMRRDHQKYIRECLAQAIFHKVLDMEVSDTAHLSQLWSLLLLPSLLHFLSVLNVESDCAFFFSTPKTEVPSQTGRQDCKNVYNFSL